MILADYFRSERDATWDFALQSGVRHGVIRLPEDERFDLTDLKKTLPSHGKCPRDFLVYGDWLIAANELSHEVTLISVSEERLVRKIAVNSPLCLVVGQLT